MPQLQRTMVEVELMSKIPTHRNIVQLLGHEVVKEDLWIFTEYCAEGNLDEYCQQKALTTEDRFRFMTEISEALQHMHKMKPPIAHRDIKPENVLMTPSGQRVITKLSDFGVSNIASTTGRMYSYAGTKEFMAPEMFRVQEMDEASYTVKVDIFSLALLMLSLVDADRKPVQAMLSKYISFLDMFFVCFMLLHN